ncbi:restriction endonuclease subunit S [Micromonospora sp. URMC 105]|uniref:restriction endonuclease subunit S n=1 Tax=Micromonospora sp. URMC 105 TaxID=3423413 RepID=UPI003F1D8AF6
MSKLNAWEGALAVVDARFHGAHVSPEYPTFSVKQESADVRYLRHLLSWPPLWGRLTPRGSMVRRKRTTAATLLATDVPLPDTDEQRRIADRLDAASQRIATSAILHEASKKLCLALYDSILGQVSDWKPLGYGLALSLDEVAVSPTETYLMAGVYGFGRGLIERDAITGSNTRYGRFNRLHSGNLVVSRLKAFEGALAIVPDSCDGRYVSPEFPTFSVIPDNLDLDYLGHLCRWPPLWRLLSKESKGIGARRERVSASRLLATKVPFPNLSEQRRIAASLGRAEAVLQLIRRQEAILVSLRRALLDAAFSGRL